MSKVEGAARRRSFSLGPALIGSLVLHAAVIILLVVEFPHETSQLILSAVPVEIVSNVQHEAAPAPPAPETPPAPQPQPPQPAPEPQPTPTPPQPAPQPAPAPKPAPEKPQPKPQPTPRPPPPKPQPKAQSKSFDLAALADSLAASNSKSPAPPRPTYHRPGQGNDEISTGPDIDALKGQISGLWHPNCGAPGSEKVYVEVRLRLRSDGSVADGPHIDNKHPNDPVWAAAADRAAIAAKAVRYRELPPQQLRLLTDRGDIRFRLDERSACS